LWVGPKFTEELERLLLQRLVGGGIRQKLDGIFDLGGEEDMLAPETSPERQHGTEGKMCHEQRRQRLLKHHRQTNIPPEHRRSCRNMQWPPCPDKGRGGRRVGGAGTRRAAAGSQNERHRRLETGRHRAGCTAGDGRGHNDVPELPYSMEMHGTQAASSEVGK